MLATAAVEAPIAVALIATGHIPYLGWLILASAIAVHVNHLFNVEAAERKARGFATPGEDQPVSAMLVPLETRRHISNVRAGIAQAERLETGTGPSAASLVADAAASARASAAPVPAEQAAQPLQRIATRHAAPAVPHALGTISWSGQGGDAEAGERRAGTHVVWSDGAVTREGGRVHWSSGRRG